MPASSADYSINNKREPTDFHEIERVVHDP
jgi:hypothetical protein